MIRTLIVDNNVTRAGLTGRAVRELKFGATVNYALSTVQALFYIAGILADRSKILPDIIVLTIPMPDTKGVDAVKALAESVAIHSVSIIVVNDSQECQDSMQYYKHGAAAMISKASEREFTPSIRACRFQRCAARMKCMWLSIRPGMTVLPCSSTTCVAAPIR